MVSLYSPLLTSAKTWEWIERGFAPVFEARDADIGFKVRLMMAALVGARREHTYEIEAASLMLISEHWIPVEGIHELPLVAQGRRFVKPLRYDAKSAAGFANAMLLDSGAAAVPLHVVSAFMKPAERLTKERTIANFGLGAWVWVWVWVTDDRMLALPKASCSTVR